jgi:hypothetical protein
MSCFWEDDEVDHSSMVRAGHDKILRILQVSVAQMCNTQGPISWPCVLLGGCD